MQNIPENLRSKIIDNVSVSLGDIIETLFTLRKWGPPPDKARIKESVQSYLNGLEEGFWSDLSGPYSRSGSAFDTDRLSRDVIRSMDKVIGLKTRSRAEIMEIFFSTRRFCSFMAGIPLTGYDPRRGIRKEKARMAGEFSRSVQKKYRHLDLEEYHLSRIPGRKPQERGGLPRIGPKIRLFGANLSKDQVNNNLALWSKREDELYNG
ncbi:MAG: hypothetical protein JW971_02935 [Synergistales bacterium]|nr:hypothetical protein [Synergistales bacterium]